MIFIYFLAFIIFGFFSALGEYLFIFLSEKIKEKIYLKKRETWLKDLKIKEKGDFQDE